MEAIDIPIPGVQPLARDPESEGTIQEQVYRALRRSLMDGAFLPGQAVTLRKLAKGLGTSPMPVREAINRLIAERALAMLPNRSVVVPRMTRALFAELSEIRMTLEGMAAAKACAHVTPQLLETLERIDSDLLDAINRGDSLAALSENRRFHFTLYEASGCKVLPAMIEGLWLQVGPFMYFSLSAPGVRWDASHHQVAIDALRAGDAEGARRAIEADIGQTTRVLQTSVVLTR